MRFSGGSLDKFKALTIIKIDEEAELYRAHHLTLGAGQTETYRLKLSEAEFFLSPEYTGRLQDVPHLALDADLQETSLETVALEIVKQAHTWIQMSARIEAFRLHVKRAVRAAQTSAEVLTAAQSFSTLLAQD